MIQGCRRQTAAGTEGMLSLVMAWKCVVLDVLAWLDQNGNDEMQSVGPRRWLGVGVFWLG